MCSATDSIVCTQLLIAAYIHLLTAECPATDSCGCSYKLLANSKILFTGVLTQLFFGTYLSAQKWRALLLLAVGCVIGSLDWTTAASMGAGPGMHWGWFTVAFQLMCSSLGSVYFQWLVQTQSKTEGGIWVENAYVYGWGILLNVLYCTWQVPQVLDGSDLALVSPGDWATVMVAALGGVCTSLILKNLDSSMKDFSNGVELATIAVSQWIVLGIPIKPLLPVSVCIVAFALHKYQQSPS